MVYRVINVALLIPESPSSKRATNGGGKRQALHRRLECKADAGAGRLLDAKSARIKVLSELEGRKSSKIKGDHRSSKINYQSS